MIWRSTPGQTSLRREKIWSRTDGNLYRSAVEETPLNSLELNSPFYTSVLGQFKRWTLCGNPSKYFSKFSTGISSFNIGARTNLFANFYASSWLVKPLTKRRHHLVSLILSRLISSSLHKLVMIPKTFALLVWFQYLALMKCCCANALSIQTSSVSAEKMLQSGAAWISEKKTPKR